MRSLNISAWKFRFPLIVGLLSAALTLVLVPAFPVSTKTTSLQTNPEIISDPSTGNDAPAIDPSPIATPDMAGEPAPSSPFKTLPDPKVNPAPSSAPEVTEVKAIVPVATPDPMAVVSTHLCHKLAYGDVSMVVTVSVLANGSSSYLGGPSYKQALSDIPATIPACPTTTVSLGN